MITIPFLDLQHWWSICNQNSPSSSSESPIKITRNVLFHLPTISSPPKSSSGRQRLLLLRGLGRVMQLWQYAPCSNLPRRPLILPPSVPVPPTFLFVSHIQWQRRWWPNYQGTVDYLIAAAAVAASDPSQPTNLPILRYLFWALQFLFPSLPQSHQLYYSIPSELSIPS